LQVVVEVHLFQVLVQMQVDQGVMEIVDQEIQEDLVVVDLEDSELEAEAETLVDIHLQKEILEEVQVLEHPL
jgi:hypothetical protein